MPSWREVDAWLWAIAGVTVLFDVVAVSATCECGPIGAPATGFVWVTFATPLLIAVVGNACYVVGRWIVIPGLARRPRSFVWLDSVPAFARDLVMLAGAAAWLIAAMHA